MDDDDEEEMEGTMTLEEISWYIDSLSAYHKIFLHRMLAMVSGANGVDRILSLS